MNIEKRFGKALMTLYTSKQTLESNILNTISYPS